MIEVGRALKDEDGAGAIIMGLRRHGSPAKINWKTHSVSP